MNAQVLMTSTSASSAWAVISIPRSRMVPRMILASTRFFAQPRLIIPTFVASRFAPPGGAGAKLFDRDIGIVVGKRLAVFSDLDCIPVEDTNGKMLAAQHHRAVGGIYPAINRRLQTVIIHDHPHKCLLQRPDLHATDNRRT